MINTQDQEGLFRLIADYLDRDIVCIAIGGTAMMFLGYKATTKDIDLVFQHASDRNTFIAAIEKLGYTQRSLVSIYDEKRRKETTKPVIYSRGEERFDLFIEHVFGFSLDFTEEKVVQRQDFIGKKELMVRILPPEFLILLKVLTSREKDFEDIENIIRIEKEIDWEFIVKEAAKRRNQNSWILLDLEEKMRRLKKVTFIKEKYFKMIYSAEEQINKK